MMLFKSMSYKKTRVHFSFVFEFAFVTGIDAGTKPLINLKVCPSLQAQFLRLYFYGGDISSTYAGIFGGKWSCR